MIDRVTIRRKRQELMGALAIGILLGTIDGALHGDAPAWVGDPGAALRALVYLMSSYALASALAAVVLPWWLLVPTAVGGFAACQAIASFLRANPQGGVGTVAVAVIAGTALAVAATWLTFVVLGRAGPRRRLVTPLLFVPAILALIAWTAGNPEPTTSHAAAMSPRDRPQTSSRVAGPNVVLISTASPPRAHCSRRQWCKPRPPRRRTLRSSPA
jgi:hypothetical protein